MKKNSFIDYLFQKSEYVKIFAFFLAFFIFFLLPILKFHSVNENYKNLQYHLLENTKKESVMKNKLTFALENKNNLEKIYKSNYQTLIKKTFSDPTVVKELLLNGLKENNLSLVTQYRLIHEKGFDSLDLKKKFVSIAIPYDILGDFNDFYSLVLSFESQPKFLMFNMHPLSIEYSKNGGVLIKFYLSSIYFLQNY